MSHARHLSIGPPRRSDSRSSRLSPAARAHPSLHGPDEASPQTTRTRNLKGAERSATDDRPEAESLGAREGPAFLRSQSLRVTPRSRSASRPSHGRVLPRGDSDAARPVPSRSVTSPRCGQRGGPPEDRQNRVPKRRAFGSSNDVLLGPETTRFPAVLPDTSTLGPYPCSQCSAPSQRMQQHIATVAPPRPPARRHRWSPAHRRLARGHRHGLTRIALRPVFCGAAMSFAKIVVRSCARPEHSGLQPSRRGGAAGRGPPRGPFSGPPARPPRLLA